MTHDASTMEFVGRVAMKWLEDFADNPKHGSYMEAVADLTTLILGGATEAAGSKAEKSSAIIGAGVIYSRVIVGGEDELDDKAQAS